MIDRFERHANTANPPTRSAAVVPSDAGEIEVSRALFIQNGGTLVVRMRDDDADWALSVDDKTQLPYRVRAIRATGTTATGIRALY